MSYKKVIPLVKDCYVQSNFSKKHTTLFTDNKTYTLQIKSEHTKNYELNKKTYKQTCLYENESTYTRSSGFCKNGH